MAKDKSENVNGAAGHRRGSHKMGQSSVPGGPDRSVMSRRQAMGRFSKGAVVAGVAAWVTPEILIATPTAAGALSAPPGGGSGNPGTPPGSGSTTGGGGSGSNPISSGSGGATIDASSGQAGQVAGTSSPAGPATAASGGSLPFTGFSALRDAEIGGALVLGGWALTRWASNTPRPAPAAETGTTSEDAGAS